MDVLILILICIALIIHRHLSAFWEIGKLPYAHGFILFVWILNILILVNFIWLFGFIAGIILTLLTFFQVIFSAILWPFLVPGVIRNTRKDDWNLLFETQKPNQLTYGGWSIIILILAVLTVINFITGNYSSVYNSIVDSMNGDHKKVFTYALLIIIGGNILRIITMGIISSRKNSKL